MSVIVSRPHRELATRLLDALLIDTWSSMADIIARDPLFGGMHLDLLLFHQEESGHVSRRTLEDGTAQFRLTSAGLRRRAEG